MSNVIPFFPKAEKESQKALCKFVDWAKDQIRWYDLPSDPVIWEAESWFKWGLKNTRVSRLGCRNEFLCPNFVDFVKAYIFRESVLGHNAAATTMMALRCLEAAFLVMKKKADATMLTAAIFNKASALAEETFSGRSPYQVSLKLKRIHSFIQDSYIVARRFTWESQIKQPRLNLGACEIAAKKKLPSEESLLALGEIFNNHPEFIDDILVTSSVAIMLSHPCRIGELVSLKKDCLITELDANGRGQLYMLWYSEKGFGSNKKIIPDSVAEICKEAVSRVQAITEDAREYAKWLEENPNVFPVHEKVPLKGLDEPLSVEEICGALRLITSKRVKARAVVKRFLNSCLEGGKSSQKIKEMVGGWLEGFDSNGKRVYEKGTGFKGLFSDTFNITLRDLNKLVRDRYLPKHFPYTDKNKITKYQDALYCFKNGAFMSTRLGAEKPFGMHQNLQGRISILLSGSGRTISIFERHGYSGIKVNSHAFRHWLNTNAQRANLSQELIARWSGRIDVSQNRVYNHISPSEKATQLAQLTPHKGEINSDLLASLKANKPIKMESLGFDDQRIVHRTEFGVCIHDYSEEPCAKFNSCLSCGEHVCVKGDDAKLANLKEEREYLYKSLEGFRRGVDTGSYGAGTWLQTTMKNLERCDELIKILEAPEVGKGALIWGEDNGWTVGRNALAMRGELLVESSNLIASDVDKDIASELEMLLVED